MGAVNETLLNVQSQSKVKYFIYSIVITMFLCISSKNVVLEENECIILFIG